MFKDDDSSVGWLFAAGLAAAATVVGAVIWSRRASAATMPSRARPESPWEPTPPPSETKKDRRLPVPGGWVADGYLTTRANHWAWDVAGKAGSPVVAPESGTIVDVYSSSDPERGDNTSVKGATDFTKTIYPGIANPWEGYGPAGVLLKGDSGVWHLLAHLSAPTVGVGDRVGVGDTVGHLTKHVGASGPHTHWEVRTSALSTPADRAQKTMNPDRWLNG